MNAAIYARKSTKDENVDDAEESDSVKRQRDGAREFIKTKGWTLHESHIYTDDKTSGKLFTKRPQFQRLMRDAKAGAFQAVVFFDLDRFGRNAHKVMVALNALADLHINVWDFSSDTPVDLDTFE